MILRSGKRYNYPEKINYHNIDFDNASKEWRKNKIYMGEGIFKYKLKEKKMIVLI